MFGDNIFGNNVDPHPPFDPRHLDDVLRKVKSRGRRRRLLVSAPFVLVIGSGLAFFLANNSFGNTQVTQVGAALALEPGMSSASVSDPGADSSESSMNGDNGSVGDSYTSAPLLEVTPVPTLSTNSLDSEQPPIGFEANFAQVLAGITPTPGATASESTDLPASTPPPPASTPDQSSSVITTASAAEVKQSERVVADDPAPEAEPTATAEPAADDAVGETAGDDEASDGDAVADDGAADEADGAGADDSGADDSGADESGADESGADADDPSDNSDADPSSAPTSTAVTDATTDLKSDDASAAAVEETSDEPAAEEGGSEPGDGAETAIADDADSVDQVAVTTETTPADEAAGDPEADGDGTGEIDDEGDGEVVFIDADGNVVTPTPVPTEVAETTETTETTEPVEPEPQPVVLEVAATIEGFSITIDIGVIDGDGYSIGACGTTVNWGDGSSHLSTCDPSCVPVDSTPGGGVDGQLSFSHVYEVSGVQVAPYITVFTGLECYGDSSTITFGPLVITEDGIVQS